MSDELSKTAPQILSSLAKDVYQDVAHPPLKTLGEALDGIFKAVSHYPRYWGLMSDISLDEKKERFRKNLQNKADSIPEDKKILPKPNILGPSIQALEYGIFDDHLSDMFSSLLAGAMNSDTAHLAHPSFVAIIEQLTSDEAKLLKYMSEVGLVPVVSLTKRSDKPDVYSIIVEKYHLSARDAQCVNTLTYREMLENLERLKLIEVQVSESGQRISDISHYLPIKMQLESDFGILIQGLENDNNIPDSYKLTLGYMYITAFGKQFVSACSK